MRNPVRMINTAMMYGQSERTIPMPKMTSTIPVNANTERDRGVDACTTATPSTRSTGLMNVDPRKPSPVPMRKPGTGTEEEAGAEADQQAGGDQDVSPVPPGAGFFCICCHQANVLSMGR